MFKWLSFSLDKFIVMAYSLGQGMGELHEKKKQYTLVSLPICAMYFFLPTITLFSYT